MILNSPTSSSAAKYKSLCGRGGGRGGDEQRGKNRAVLFLFDATLPWILYTRRWLLTRANQRTQVGGGGEGERGSVGQGMRFIIVAVAFKSI